MSRWLTSRCFYFLPGPIHLIPNTKGPPAMSCNNCFGLWHLISFLSLKYIRVSMLFYLCRLSRLSTPQAGLSCHRFPRISLVKWFLISTPASILMGSVIWQLVSFWQLLGLFRVLAFCTRLRQGVFSIVPNYLWGVSSTVFSCQSGVFCSVTIPPPLWKVWNEVKTTLPSALFRTTGPMLPLSNLC